MKKKQHFLCYLYDFLCVHIHDCSVCLKNECVQKCKIVNTSYLLSFGITPKKKNSYKNTQTNSRLVYTIQHIIGSEISLNKTVLKKLMCLLILLGW